MSVPLVDIHYARPGRDATVYRQFLIDDGPAVKVSFHPHTPVPGPVSVDGTVILEPGSPVVWFTFPGAWHDIGLFHLEDGTRTGIYANVLTPVDIESSTRWSTTDLFLDVWVPTRGEARLLDQDELQEALARGWVDGTLADRALEEGARLLREHGTGRWPPDVVSEWPLERAVDATGGKLPGVDD